MAENMEVHPAMIVAWKLEPWTFWVLRRDPHIWSKCFFFFNPKGLKHSAALQWDMIQISGSPCHVDPEKTSSVELPKGEKGAHRTATHEFIQILKKSDCFLVCCLFQQAQRIEHLSCESSCILSIPKSVFFPFYIFCFSSPPPCICSLLSTPG